MMTLATIDALPNYCYECPCYNHEHCYCQADKERKYSEYRPYWCPLKEIVRCKECKYYMTIHCTCDGCCISDDWFCADGVKKND